MNEQSPRWRLNIGDMKRWGRNAGVFLAPVATIYLLPVADGLKDGINLTDFVPSPLVQGAMLLYVINTIMDFLQKLKVGPK